MIKFTKIFFTLILVIFLGYLTINLIFTNIHGDAYTHTLIIKQIVEESKLIDHIPYFIMDIWNGNIIFFPVPYSLFYHLSLVPFYMLGNELFLKLSSLLFMGLIFIFVIKLFPKNYYLGAISCILIFIFNIRRFFMAPLMEEMLLFFMIVSIYYLSKFIDKGKIKHLVLCSIFTGLVLSLKLQGLIFLLGAILILIIYFIKEKYFLLNYKKKFIKYNALFLLVVLVVSFTPLVEQYRRNGSFLANAPGEVVEITQKLPDTPFFISIKNLFTTKYPLNESSIEELSKIIGYKLKGVTLYTTFKQFALYPIFFEKSFFVEDQFFWLVLFSILFLFGISYIYKKNSNLAFILVIFWILEFFAAYSFRLYIHQYLLLGLSIFAIFVAAGLFGIASWFRYFQFNKIIILLLIFLLTVTIIPNYFKIYHQKYWLNEGRFTKQQSYAYRNIGECVEKFVPKNAIFLTSGIMRDNYKRNSFWINPGGGSKIPLIFQTKDPQEALSLLKDYNVDYILIDQLQTRRKGLFDFIPKEGLVSYIDNNDHFLPTCSSGNLYLYKIIY